MTRTMIYLLATILLAATGHALAADEIQVTNVLVKLIEQVEVPARQCGVLDRVLVKEGEMVAAGDTLARLDETEAVLALRRAQVELNAADKQAASDVKVRFARKALEVSKAELQRSIDAQARLPQSVSQSEMDQLRLVVERNALEIEQAQLERELAASARELKQADVALAEQAILERRVTAPMNGFVAQVLRHGGEWVQPGQTILRLLRLDRLRAEGLVPAQTTFANLVGAPVLLSVTLGDKTVEFPGQIVFVSPEIDPVNGQVRIWADIENTDLQLRPGLHGSMAIVPMPPAQRAVRTEH